MHTDTLCVSPSSLLEQEKALAKLPPESADNSSSDDESPEHPLPLYQQRENFYS